MVGGAALVRSAHGFLAGGVLRLVALLFRDLPGAGLELASLDAFSAALGAGALDAGALGAGALDAGALGAEASPGAASPLAAGAVDSLPAATGALGAGAAASDAGALLSASLDGAASALLASAFPAAPGLAPATTERISFSSWTEPKTALHSTDLPSKVRGFAKKRVIALQGKVKFPDFSLTFSDQTGRFPGCNSRTTGVSQLQSTFFL